MARIFEKYRTGSWKRLYDFFKFEWRNHNNSSYIQNYVYITSLFFNLGHLLLIHLNISFLFYLHIARQSKQKSYGKFFLIEM